MVRIKNRYMVVQIREHTPVQNLNIREGVLANCVLQNVKKFYGDFGLGTVEQGLRVKYCNPKTKIAIIRCSHKSYRYVSSILPLITKIGDIHAKFLTLYIGATIIHCNKFILKHQRKFLDQTIGGMISLKERQDFIKNVKELIM